MSHCSTYLHHNDSMTQPPPSEPKFIQGRRPEAFPSQRYLGVGGRMQWVWHHPASLPEVLKSEAAWASMPKKHREQTSKEEKLTSANRWQTSREDLTSVAKKPSRATIGICVAQTKGIESIDSRHRRREVDISEAPTRGIRLKSRHRKQRVDISISFQLPSICLLHLHRVWELLWVHQRNPSIVPAFVHPVLASCQKGALQHRALRGFSLGPVSSKTYQNLQKSSFWSKVDVMELMNILIGKTTQKDTCDVVTSCFFLKPNFFRPTTTWMFAICRKVVKNFFLMTMIHNPSPHLPWMLFWRLPTSVKVVSLNIYWDVTLSTRTWQVEEQWKETGGWKENMNEIITCRGRPWC